MPKAIAYKLVDGVYTPCQSPEITHLHFCTPGPFKNRFIPVITRGKREGTGNWTWNGDLDKPTLRPSVLTWTNTDRCHMWVTDGQVHFLNDCSHEFRGMVTDLLDID